MGNVGVYAGSFDPFTHGHDSVLYAASFVFERIVVAVGVNTNKPGLFTVPERKQIIQKYISTAGFHCGIEVDSFKGLLVEYCRELQKHCSGNICIVRGLRAVSDLESELAIADANSKQDPNIPTIFIPAPASKAYISSSMVRELARYRESNLSSYVLKSVEADLRRKLGSE